MIDETYWSRFQETYDKNQEFVVGTELLDKVKEELNSLPGLGDVLELGCGTGYFTETIIQKADHVFATDLSDELLETAAKRFSNNEKISIQKEDCMNISFASDEFDCVFMANLIHVIENPLKALRESHRVLKENGLLIITSFTNHSMKPFEVIKLGLRYMKVWGKPPQYTHRFSLESLGLLMGSAGFLVEKSQLIGNKTKSLYLIGKKINT